MDAHFIFTFRQVVLGGRSMFLQHSFIARTHAEAFALWCSSPAIQNLSMDECGMLTVTVEPVK